jgi:hypothetical protein
MKTELHNPVSFNARAVALLQENQFKAATKLLRKGLQCCLDQQVACEETDLDLDDSAHNTSQLVIKTIPIHRIKNDASQHMPGSNFLFFNRAFAVAAASMYDSCFSPMQERRMALILLYNTGLACHNQAIQSTRGHAKSSTLFEAALGFYEKAASLLLQDGEDIIEREASHNQQLGMMVMALFNNMGHIFAHFYDFESSRICRDWIGRILSSMQRIPRDSDSDFSSSASDDSSSDDDDDEQENNDERDQSNFAFFFENTYFQSTRCRIVTSAAA